MKSRFEDVYSDPNRVVCSSIFQQVEAMSKNWVGIQLASKMDDAAFFTILANHPLLPKVIDACVSAVDLSHSTSSRNLAVGKAEQDAIALVILRIMTTIQSPLQGPATLSITSVASRLSVLLPTSVLFPISLMLQRYHGKVATTAITCFVLQSPSFLSRLPAAVGSWSDNINAVAVKCVAEAKRGRFQRTSTDTLSLIEVTYRLTKHMWAMLQSLPLLADYMPLSTLLHTLRVIVDVISPLLQYFVLSCEGLAVRRSQLSRANAMLVNAAMSTAVVALLFSSYFSNATNSREHLLPEKVKQLSDAITGEIEQNTSGGVPLAVLRCAGNSVSTALAQLCQVSSGGGDGKRDNNRLGPLLCGFLEPITSVDIKAVVEKNQTERFFEIVLLELVHQGVHVDTLLARQFLLPDEARRLGASEESVQRALFGEDYKEQKVQRQAALASADDDNEDTSPIVPPSNTATDENVAIILSVLPHLNPQAVAAALQTYYANDVEHFIVDATSDNLPPHLIEGLHSSFEERAAPPPAASSKPVASASSAPPPKLAYVPQGGSVFVDGLELVDEHMHRLISSDLQDLIDGDYDDGGADFGGYQVGRSDFDDEGLFQRHESGMIALGHDSGTASELFCVDDEMKEKIKRLQDMMYDDERDDGNDIGEYASPLGDRGEDDDDGGPRRTRGERERSKWAVEAAAASPQPEQAASAEGAKGNAASKPKYAAKEKSKRSVGDKKAVTHKRNTQEGVTKNDLKKILKKGGAFE